VAPPSGALCLNSAGMLAKMPETVDVNSWSIGCYRARAMNRTGGGQAPAGRTRRAALRAAARAGAALFAVITIAGLPSTARAQEQGSPPAATATVQAPGSPEVPQGLTLDEALRIFRARGFDLLLAEAQVRSAEADEHTAAAIPNPGLNGGV